MLPLKKYMIHKSMISKLKQKQPTLAHTIVSQSQLPTLFLAERMMDAVNARIPNIPLITMTNKKFKGKT